MESEFYIIKTSGAVMVKVFIQAFGRKFSITLLCRKELYNTVERRYYECLYNEVCGINDVSKILLVVYYQCCVLIG